MPAARFRWRPWSGTLLTAAVYVAVSAVAISLVPQQELAASEAPFAELLIRFLGAGSGRCLTDLAKAQRATGDYYEFLETKVGAAAKDLEPMDEVLKRYADLPQFRHLENYDSLHRANMNRAFTEFETQ